MKKHPDTSRKARCAVGWHKHLRKGGKRMANRATRRKIKSWNDWAETNEFDIQAD